MARSSTNTIDVKREPPLFTRSRPADSTVTHTCSTPASRVGRAVGTGVGAALVVRARICHALEEKVLIWRPPFRGSQFASVARASFQARQRDALATRASEAQARGATPESQGRDFEDALRADGAAVERAAEKIQRSLRKTVARRRLEKPKLSQRAHTQVAAALKNGALDTAQGGIASLSGDVASFGDFVNQGKPRCFFWNGTAGRPNFEGLVLGCTDADW